MDKSLKTKAINLRHTLHSYPELSGCETETKKTVMDFLKENTTLQIVDRGLWFYGKYSCQKDEGKNNSIAFRADFDAIKVFEDDVLQYASKNPGIAHKCGHDGHTAALCAFAMEVCEKGADRDIYFIFQQVVI